MSNLSPSPPADRRSVEQDRDAEIGGIYNALADETRQLLLDSGEIAATRMPFSGSSQPVPQVTMTPLTTILESFQDCLMEVIDKRLSEESTINLRHGGNVIRDRFEAISSPIASQNPRQLQQFLPLAGSMHGFMGPSRQHIVQSLEPTAEVEKSVPHRKYQKVTLISTDLSTKFKFSFNDKSFDNLNALSRALGASNLLSLVNGSRLIPQQSDNNVNGYTPSSITVSSDPLSLNRNVVIDVDDIYCYAEEETTAFRFIESFSRCIRTTYN